MRTSLLVLVAACASDPTLRVDVAPLDGYAVAQTIVTAYDGSQLSCEQIRLGDRTDVELSALTTDQTEVGSDLTLARLGDKTVVARGYTTGQQLATAGCADVGELVGDTDVQIAMVPASVVAIDPDQSDRPFAERHIAVTMADINGKPLEGTVGWQMYGGAGVDVPAPNPGVATSNGKVVLPIADLGVPGPEGMRVRAPWATAPLPLQTAFDLSGSSTIAFNGTGVLGTPACAIRGHAGKLPTAICLAGTVLGHRDLVEVGWTGAWTTTPHPIATAITNLQYVIVDRNGSADEPAYAFGGDSNGTWYDLASNTAKSVVFAGPIQRVAYIPACGGGAAVVAVGSSAAVQLFTPAGSNPKTLPGFSALSSGGCVSDVDGGQHQAIVAVNGTGDPMLFLLDSLGTGIAIKKNAGTGFIATESGEQRFVGTRLEAEGSVVFEAVLAGANLVERAERAAAAVPTTIASGRIDADTGYDLLWDIEVPLTGRKIFQMTLAKQVLGVPLTAITSGPNGAGVANGVGFLVADLNGKGVDEVILYTAAGATIYSPDQ